MSVGIDRDDGARWRVSGTLIVNTLCCAIGAVYAYNAYWVIRYWGVFVDLWTEAWRWSELMR